MALTTAFPARPIHAGLAPPLSTRVGWAIPAGSTSLAPDDPPNTAAGPPAAATAAVVVQYGEPAGQAGRDAGHDGIGPVHQRPLHQDDCRARAGLIEADDGAVGRGHRARSDNVHRPLLAGSTRHSA